MLEGRRLDAIDSTRAIFKFIINLNIEKDYALF